MDIFEFVTLSSVFVVVFLITFMLLRVQSQFKGKVVRNEQMSEYERIRAKSPVGKIKPFLEKIVKLNRRNKFLTTRMKKNRNRWHKLLTNAGSPGNLTPEDFFVLKQLAPLVAILFLLLFGVHHFILYLILLTVAYFLPDIWLNDCIKARQRKIAHSLPDSLDTFTVMVGAGLDFGEAIKIYIQQNRMSPFIEEFYLFQNEMKLGKSRIEALQSMASRINYTPFSNFSSAVIQAEKMGVSLAKTLQNQSNDLREKRFQFAEEMGHKAVVKMMLPTILLIFPIIFIILFAPVALNYFIK